MALMVTWNCPYLLWYFGLAAQMQFPVKPGASLPQLWVTVGALSSFFPGSFPSWPVRICGLRIVADDNRQEIGQIERCIYRETIETRDAAGAPEATWVQTA